jgi:energy-coupling factor transporter ATP-binding protein EcfA2
MADPISTVVTGAKGVSTAISLAKQAKELGLLEKLINVFKKKHKILVLGATGVGKSQLMKSLVTEIPEAISNMNRTGFKEDIHLKISKNIFHFVDTPGQKEHKQRRKDEILEAMKHGIEGIINVAAYGYHESRVGKNKVFDETGKIRDDFLKERQKVEIDLLSEWTELLGDKGTSKWLITLVNKADLWWDNKDDIISHYESGEYFKALGSAKTLSPSVLHYCAVFHKFYGESPISGFFDDKDRVQAKENLLAQLISAIGKGGLKL